MEASKKRTAEAAEQVAESKARVVDALRQVAPFLVLEENESFFEKYDFILARACIFLLCCCAWGYMLSDIPEASNASGIDVFCGDAFLWLVFLVPLFAVLQGLPEFRFSKFPFLRSEWLKDKPAMRFALGVVELLIVASFVFVVIMFSLWLALLVFLAVCAIVAAVVRLF